MLSLEEIVKRLSQRNLKEVARVSGVNYLTVYNVAKRLHSHPHKRTLAALTIYFEENP